MSAMTMPVLCRRLTMLRPSPLVGFLTSSTVRMSCRSCSSHDTSVLNMSRLSESVRVCRSAWSALLCVASLRSSPFTYQSPSTAVQHNDKTLHPKLAHIMFCSSRKFSTKSVWYVIFTTHVHSKHVIIPREFDPHTTNDRPLLWHHCHRSHKPWRLSETSNNKSVSSMKLQILKTTAL